MTIWEAAQAAAAQEKQDRISRAREQLQQFVGPDVTLPPHNLINDMGVILHDTQRGLLFADGGVVRYVVRETSGEITAVGGPLTSLADLGRLLA